MVRIIKNTDLISIHDFMFDVSTVIGIGNNSASSSSKIMKVTVIRKNRDENGSRGEFFLVRGGGGRIRIQMGNFFLGLLLFSLRSGLLGL
jgi:hypothetical protein